MSRTAAAVAAVIILLAMLASPAVAQVVAPNAGDVDVDADATVGDANTGTTIDSGNTNTDASVDNSVDDSGNVTTDASVGSNNTTASYNNTEANPTTITEANPTTITEANPTTITTTGDVASPTTITKTGDVGSGNTLYAPVTPIVEVGVNCSVIAHCEDNDTYNDNDSCNFNSCHQDNSSVHVEDNSTNIDDSFNGNRDSFNGSALAFGLDSGAVVDGGKRKSSSISRFLAEVERRPVLRDTVFISGESEAGVRGKSLPFTGMSDELLRRYIITALLGFSLLGAGLLFNQIGGTRRQFVPLTI